MGEYDLARRAFEGAVKRGHREGASTYNIACGHALAGDASQAFDALERAIELGFGDGDTFDDDEDLDSLCGDARYEALAKRADLLDLPADGDGWGWGGRGRTSRRAWERALQGYEAYLGESPSSGRAWFNIGYAALGLDDPARAAEAFHEAHELGYRRATTEYNLACAYARKGDKDQAFAWLDRARASGFDDDWHLAADPDLDSLRDDPRFPEVKGLERHGMRWLKKLQHWRWNDDEDDDADHDDDEDDEDDDEE